MAWYRKSRRLDLGTFVAPEPLPEASLDELVEEGELLSLGSVRLAVKNLIILGSLRDRSDFDEERYVRAVGDEFLALAAERDDDAARVDAELAVVEQRPGRSTHFHDYRSVDAATLQRRATYARAHAARLRELAGDHERARQLVAVARDLAWEEIAASLRATLLRAADQHKQPDYLIDRGEKLRLLESDLTDLIRRREREQGN